MTHEDLIVELTNHLNWTQTKISGALDATVAVINEQLSENGQIAVPDFGTFETRTKSERISINTQTQERYLIPPKIVVELKPISLLEKYSINDLLPKIAEQSGLSEDEAKFFVKELFIFISLKLSVDNPIKIKDFGIFKLKVIQADDRIDTNIGEKAHNQVSFIPSNTLKELVNKPFSHFEATLLNEGFTLEGVPFEEDEEDEDAEEFIMETKIMEDSKKEEIVIQVEETPTPVFEEETNLSYRTIKITEADDTLPRIQVVPQKSQKTGSGVWTVLAAAAAIVLVALLMKKDVREEKHV